ncbi:hypothetical protein, partial [Streptococcus pneumoniae]
HQRFYTIQSPKWHGQWLGFALQASKRPFCVFLRFLKRFSQKQVQIITKQTQTTNQNTNTNLFYPQIKRSPVSDFPQRRLMVTTL